MELQKPEVSVVLRSGKFLSPRRRRRSTQEERSPALVAIKWLLISVLVATLSEHLQLASCSRVQDEQRAQEQQSSSAVDQIPTYSTSSGSIGDYSALIGDNLVNFGQRIYSNGKRARKVSGFMPMRGRKDGRDQGERIYLPLQSSDEEIITNTPILRDNDGETSILRIVAAGSSGQFAGQFPEHFRWSSFGPKQFANQFAMQHLMASAAAADNNRALLSGGETGGGGGSSLEGENGGQQRSQLLVGDSSNMMQAKLRRAFHPMRGKKSDQLFEEAAYASADETI